MKLILASRSPRRIEILKNLGFDPQIIPAETDENISENFSPADAVCELACRKAKYVAQNASDEDMILAADTMVFKDGVLLGKPDNNDAAFKMLRSLSGNTHSVFTGFCVIYGGKTVSCAVETKVKFRELSDGDICEYIATGEPDDKAGAYGIQGIGCLLVDHIDGDYFNVVGLPASKLFDTIKKEFSLSRTELLSLTKQTEKGF
ncbi:MAG: septum formation inhibitor Maf [Clostridia bacterium]|nr:septum formation inhibitor Maf [Clostridia bacterium]